MKKEPQQLPWYCEWVSGWDRPSRDTSVHGPPRRTHKLPRWGGPGARWDSSHGSGEDTALKESRKADSQVRKESASSWSLSNYFMKDFKYGYTTKSYKQYLTISSIFLKVYIFKQAKGYFFGIYSHWQTRPTAFHQGTWGGWGIPRAFE